MSTQVLYRSYQTIDHFILNQNVCRFSDDGEMIATSSDDGTIRLWDPDTGKEIHVFNEPKGFACHLDWHPSGSCIGKNLFKVLSGGLQSENDIMYPNFIN